MTLNTSQKKNDDLFDDVFSGLKEIQAMNTEQLRQWMTEQPFLPPTLPGGRGMRFITDKGLMAVRELGQKWLAEHPALSGVLTPNAAENMMARVISELLDDAKNLPDETDIKVELYRRLNEKIEESTIREHFYFPACVFEQSDVDTFTIGPINFYRREDWLNAVEKYSGTSQPWKEKVFEVWRSGPSFLDRATGLWFKVAKRIPKKIKVRRSPPFKQEKEVLETIGAAEWVIDVPVEGRDRSRSKDCAEVAALVALESLGLSLDLKNARNLRGPRHQLNRQMTHRLSQNEGRGLNKSWSMDSPHLGGKPGEQATLLRNNRKLRKAVGNALESFIEPSPSGRAPELKRRWVEAMYWYGQARREQSDFIALVKHGIALDVLAKGGRSRGIVTLSCAVLNLTEGDAITSDGRTLRALVEKLYNDGRSQIAHGGRLALLQELPLERQLADMFCGGILVGYVACLDKYTGQDTYKDFLAALPSIRASL